MKTLITKILTWVFISLLYTNTLFAQYSNATLNGQWILHNGPISTANAEADTSLTYIGFDGNGNITDWENFGPISGTDSVTASGVISLTLIISDISRSSADTARFSAQLISQNYATMGPGAGLSRILNPGALTDSLVGVLNSPIAGQKYISILLNSQGQIISSTGLTPPVSGRVYADSGIFMGHINTGDATMYTLDSLGSSWDEFTIIGPYVNDSLNGVLILDGPKNHDPRGTVSLVRNGTATGINPAETRAVPESFSLSQNYPNPFNPSTTISFNLPSKSYVSLKVFDMLGREVITLVSEEMPAGNYTRQWNPVNMSSGIYFYRLQAGSFNETKKLILLR